MAKNVVVKAEKVYGRKKKYSSIKLILSISILVLALVFIVLGVIYKGGKFTITLDKRLSSESGIVIYEDSEIKESKRKLSARDLEFMDNISIDWIPKNIDTESNGSHNGENYIAYTFYIENEGEEAINYWYSIIIDDVIKNVDEAARVMVYLNGDRRVYTLPFYIKDEAVLEQRKDFKPGNIDKFTIVIWLEGDDPDCIDNILGGEIKMHMEIREEHKEESKNNEKE